MLGTSVDTEEEEGLASLVNGLLKLAADSEEPVLSGGGDCKSSVILKGVDGREVDFKGEAGGGEVGFMKAGGGDRGAAPADALEFLNLWLKAVREFLLLTLGAIVWSVFSVISAAGGGDLTLATS